MSEEGETCEGDEGFHVHFDKLLNCVSLKGNLVEVWWVSDMGFYIDIAVLGGVSKVIFNLREIARSEETSFWVIFQWWLGDYDMS